MALLRVLSDYQLTVALAQVKALGELYKLNEASRRLSAYSVEKFQYLDFEISRQSIPLLKLIEDCRERFHGATTVLLAHFSRTHPSALLRCSYPEVVNLPLV